jgi:peptidoglycan-associated lipoprotein
MSKTVRAFLCGTSAIALALTGVACHKNKPPVVTATQATEAPAPIVAPPPPPPPTATVPTNTDFVQPEPKPVEETLPRDADSLNRVAQERGYIQDAYYTYDEASLSPEAQAALTASANWLKSHSDLSLLIEGHCDERGTEQYNLALGDRRANSARDFLATLGIEPGRMRTVSYGEERPFANGHDDSAWSKNRRAHLVLVK